MGASSAPGIPHQSRTASFYGGGSVPKLPVRLPGRRTMPGGPLLPKLPRNPLATVARQMTQRSIPRSFR